jgi:hypothetical protein
MSRTINLILLIVLFNGVIETNASDFFTKLSQSATKVKSQLLEFFYRFRAFFTGHSETTHQLMTTRGCGYAIDDEPTIYNKRGNVIGKIKGGDDAVWHTW